MMPLKQLKLNIPLLAFVVSLVIATVVFSATATTVTVLADQISVADTANSNSLSNGIVTITAKGSLFSQKTNTVTIKNISSSKAAIQFDFEATTYNSFTIDGENKGAKGTYSKTLEANTSITLTLKSNKGLSDTTATLKLSNFTYKEAAGDTSITMYFDGNKGTVSLNDASITNGSTINIAGGVAKAIATAKSGCRFIAWVDKDSREIIYTDENNNLTLPKNIKNLEAIFVTDAMDSNAYFRVGTALYLGWDAAISAAKPDNTVVFSSIILMNNAVLASGDYTIPSGITLLIPYDSANTLCTTSPTILESNNTTKCKPYRTLTLATGTHIQVDGAISIGGQQYCSRPIGAVNGDYGVIEMNSGSTITVNNGGSLYAWGYVSGVKSSDNKISEGTVTIKNGGIVYEDFQVVDWRGGNASSGMIGNDNNVFPMSQYYVQNVQVPMTLESGATEITHISVKVDASILGVYINEADTTFIGNSGMFVLGQNSKVIKDYDETTDRLCLEVVEGSVILGNVSMDLQVSILPNATIDSAEYVLPLNNNITIIARSGTTLSSSNDIALLPGSELIIEAGANCNLTKGSCYIYDLDEWTYPEGTNLDGNTYDQGGFCGEFNDKFLPVPYAHNRVYTRKESDLTDAKVVVNGTINISSGAYVYTTSGGANITSTGNGKIVFQGSAGTASNTYQAIATKSDRTGVSYLPISITSAKLLNANGEYTSTNPSGTFVYYNGSWVRGPSVLATNIAVRDALDMYFYVDAALVAYYDGAYAKINGGDKINLSSTANADKYFRFSFSGIAARQMCDTITVDIYNKNNQLCTTFTTSVQEYATTLINSSSDEVTPAHKTALVDMLNYGAAAQIYYGYNDQDLASATLTAEQKAWGSTGTPDVQNSGSCSPNIVWGSRLQLINKFGMHFTFDGITKTEGQMSATMTIGEKTVALTWLAQEEGTDVHGNKIYRYFFSTGATGALSITDARETVTVVVKDASGNEVCTITDSVESYIARMLAGQALYGIDDGGKMQYKEQVSGIEQVKMGQLTDLLNKLMLFSDSAKSALEGGYLVNE